MEVQGEPGANVTILPTVPRWRSPWPVAPRRTATASAPGHRVRRPARPDRTRTEGLGRWKEPSLGSIPFGAAGPSGLVPRGPGATGPTDPGPGAEGRWDDPRPSP